MSKPKKPLSDAQKWKNICDALAEDVLNDEEPPSVPPERIERVKAGIRKAVQDWTAKEEAERAKKKGPRGIN